MTRIRTYFAIGAVALAAPLAIAGCGGDDGGDVDPQTVLDETFSTDEAVSSGNLSLSLSGSAEGDAGGSFEATLAGPFQGDAEDPAAIPQLDWTGSISGESNGQSISFEGSLVVTEDNAYVEYGGNAYEVGTDLFGQFKQMAERAAAQQSETEGLSITDAFTQSCESQIEAAGGDTSACQIDFESWLGDLTSEGTEDIEGTESDHVSGTVDVETMLQDLVELGSAVPQSSGTVPSEEQVQQVADAITEASFDLYSTTDTHNLDGIDFNLALDPSAIPDADAEGVDSVDVAFSMRLGAINEEQTIDAPSDAQPLEGLLQQFGIDPSSLGGLGAVGASGLPGLSAPDVPQAGGGGGSDAADAYLDCIAQANTPNEINDCASQL